jgi:hypothetical protein
MRTLPPWLSFTETPRTASPRFCAAATSPAGFRGYAHGAGCDVQVLNEWDSVLESGEQPNVEKACHEQGRGTVDQD